MNLQPPPITYGSYDQTTFFMVPESSDWSCEIAGVTYVPSKGKEPNAFHRFMQRLAFGVKWKKAK